MSDPTYRTEAINADPLWRLAFVLSEIDNDTAPIGWGTYIWKAEALLEVFDVTPKQEADDAGV